jgi:DNA-binding SARP family transcriptional activator
VLRDRVPAARRRRADRGRAGRRELLEVAPLRETGHLLLMESLAARGNVAEALAAYERLRVLLRESLGVDPGRAAQDTYAQLLG